MPGTLTHSVSDITAQLLIDLGLASDPTGTDSWPVFVSSLPDRPDDVIAIVDTTGVHNGRFMVNGEVQERHGIQIIVRAMRFTAGWAKADVIGIALDGVLRSTVTIDSEGYFIQAISRTAGPISLGQESAIDGGDTPHSRREVFSINCTVPARQS